ncbi:AraC family transcriptional regulator [Arsenicibacter rosenii]|uniref:AraC family transcriptional regulator n=1 Tax=Arsenicibacter rosenii TaxID=1750698 RepID=A0A1S2VPN6_9BACT|nr:AraC family transcriptional regulator [Arsenicibacter rosenii]OIN60733.1 AraC family transcriptional regulator [Arsenicibacter rosenii]
MKPQLLRVSLTSENSFSVRRDVVLYFYDRWHYHPEIELLHIEQGSGTQFVGDNIQNFQAGDVFLIGSNLPHYWRCDNAYFENRKDLVAQATVVHFLENFWGDQFLQLPENRPVARFLEKARQGIRLFGELREGVKVLMHDMLTQTGTDKVITLMRILALMARSEEWETLSSSEYPGQFNEADTDRINRIYAYALANFQQKVTLDEIAAVANMSPHSFCRYFKSRSRKSFSQFMLELRVHHACKMLIDGQLPVSQVCFDSGFNQFSTFNKYFKEITGKSPGQYRKEFKQG